MADTGTTAPAVVDQAHCRGRAIPTELSKPLQGVSKVLEGRVNYNTWSFTVKRTLMAARLEQLIDPSIPRPSAEDPLYNTWEDISLQVGYWLTGQISEPLQAQLYTGSAPIDYADEVFEAIRAISVGHGALQLKIAVLRATRMTRSQFPALRDFIQKFKETTLYAHQLKADIGPHMSALTLIHEVREDLTVWAATRQDQLTDDPSTFNWDDFKKLCESALALCEAENDEIIASAVRAKPLRRSNNRFNNSNDSSNDSQEKQHRHRRGPPPNLTPEQYVQSFMAIKVNKDGNCGYCFLPGHDTTRCWFLVPTARPSDWVPNGSIWAYNPTSNDDDDDAGANLAIDFDFNI